MRKIEQKNVYRIVIVILFIILVLTTLAFYFQLELISKILFYTIMLIIFSIGFVLVLSFEDIFDWIVDKFKKKK